MPDPVTTYMATETAHPSDVVAANKAATSKLFVGVDDYMPSGNEKAAYKLAHHRDDHLLRQDSKITGKRSVNMTWHAIKESWWPTLRDASKLVLLGGMLVGFKGLATFIPGMETIAASIGELARQAVEFSIAAFTTGTLWYGAKNVSENYEKAKEHNRSLVEQYKTTFKGLGRARQQAIERETDEHDISFDKPRKSLVEGALFVTGSVPAIAHVDVQAAEHAAARQQAQPSYLSQILEEGPKRLNPRDVADRLARERAGGVEHSV